MLFRFNYLRLSLHIRTKHYDSMSVVCANELDFYKLLNTWNRQARDHYQYWAAEDEMGFPLSLEQSAEYQLSADGLQYLKI